MSAAPAVVLFDLDGVLAHYVHAPRLALLAERCHRTPFAGALARQARVAILTNNNLLLRDHLARICPPLFPLFEGRVFCSAQFRLAKPDPAIFLACAAMLGATPGEVLFIDDKADNAEGARRAGLRAHHYRDLPTLRGELRELGLAEETSDAT